MTLNQIVQGKKLLTLIEAEISIEDISIIFQKTEFEIMSRLIKICCEELQNRNVFFEEMFIKVGIKKKNY